MKSKEEIRDDLDELETEEEIQDYLENLWMEAKEDASNIERLMFQYQWDDLNLDDVKTILENDFKGVQHK